MRKYSVESKVDFSVCVCAIIWNLQLKIFFLHNLKLNLTKINNIYFNFMIIFNLLQSLHTLSLYVKEFTFKLYKEAAFWVSYYKLLTIIFCNSFAFLSTELM